MLFHVSREHRNREMKFQWKRYFRGKSCCSLH